MKLAMTMNNLIPSFAFRTQVADSIFKQPIPLPQSSFRGDAKHRTRNLEIPGLVLRTIPE